MTRFLVFLLTFSFFQPQCWFTFQLANLLSVLPVFIGVCHLVKIIAKFSGKQPSFAIADAAGWTP
jgi:hypothetical protein